MNELRFAAACLEGGGRGFPTLESVSHSFADERKEAEAIFRKALEQCPDKLELEIEDCVLHLINAWTSESFERGFVAGMRMTAQALARE